MAGLEEITWDAAISCSASGCSVSALVRAPLMAAKICAGSMSNGPQLDRRSRLLSTLSMCRVNSVATVGRLSLHSLTTISAVTRWTSGATADAAARNRLAESMVDFAVCGSFALNGWRSTSRKVHVSMNTTGDIVALETKAGMALMAIGTLLPVAARVVVLQ